MVQNKKLGIVLSPLDKWNFFNEIYEDLKSHYEVDVFQFDPINTPIFYAGLNRPMFHRKLKSFLRTRDVVFFEWASDWLAYASKYPKECQIVTRLHSFELLEWAPKINWDAVDIVILVSYSMYKAFGELYPDHLHKAQVIHNGVSLTEFNPIERSAFNLDLGMLCNIKPVKRVYEIILAVHELINQGYNARLHVAGAPRGDKRYAAAVYRLVDKLDLEDAVQFYGHVSDTAAWLRGIDIFISNSYWEGHQVALIEAMASGCYCLSHFWAGAEETLPAENLFATEAELQRKISDYADQQEVERERQQNLMRAIACEKFDIEQTKFKTRAAIEEVGLIQ